VYFYYIRYTFLTIHARFAEISKRNRKWGPATGFYFSRQTLSSQRDTLPRPHSRQQGCGRQSCDEHIRESF